MNERRKQREFLKSMLQLECHPEELEKWQSRIDKAEREERCLVSSLRLVLLIFLLSISGLGYCGLFLGGSITHSPQFLIKVFSALTVACGLCFLVFCCVGLYYRHLTDRICAEGRQFLISMAQSRSTFIFQSPSRPASSHSSIATQADASYTEGLPKVA